MEFISAISNAGLPPSFELSRESSPRNRISSQDESRPPTPPPLTEEAFSRPHKITFLYRHRIQPAGLYTPDAKRYVLYVSEACPFSSRCLCYWALKQLSSAIQIGFVAPVWQQCPLHQQRRSFTNSPAIIGETMSERHQRISTSGIGTTTSSNLQCHTEKPLHLVSGMRPAAPTPPLEEYAYLQQELPVMCGGPERSPGRVRDSACRCGWYFDPSKGFSDPLGKFHSVGDIYALSLKNNASIIGEVSGGEADTSVSPLSKSSYTLPLLFDTVTNTIVNNCCSDICLALNEMFGEVAKAPEVNLAPRFLHRKIREMNKQLVKPILFSIFECGRAKEQLQYEREANALFLRLDKVERILSLQRYLCSSTHIADSDIRLATVLFRFDDVYAMCCRCNAKLIRADYPNILEWLRDIVQTGNLIPYIGNLQHAKLHYFSNPMNPLGPPGGFRITPQGCRFDRFLVQPHSRHIKFSPTAHPPEEDTPETEADTTEL